MARSDTSANQYRSVLSSEKGYGLSESTSGSSGSSGSSSSNGSSSSKEDMNSNHNYNNNNISNSNNNNNNINNNNSINNNNNIMGSRYTSNNNNNNNNNGNKKYLSLTEALAQIQMIVSGEQEKGAKPYQEDSTCIFYSPDLTVIVGAVFDGHGGLNGQVASSRSAKLTHEYFKKNWQRIRTWTKEQWRKEMINWFDEMHNRVRTGFVEVERSYRKANRQSEDNVIDNKGVIRKLSGFPIHGGTTATIFTAIRLPTNKWRLVCANVGDSDCLLLARKPTRLSNNQTYMHLSVDHSPDSSLEYLRIKSLPVNEYPLKLLFVYDQAEVYRKYECPLVFLENGTKDPKYVKNSWGHNLRPTNVRYDPAVYAVSPPGVVNDVTCIAMTRSLGDFYAHQFGLSHEPDITFYDWNCTDECVVTIGSDGIWDCWKWEAFADYVNGNLTKSREQIDKVTRTALQHTVARAKACFGESSFDDASLVLVSLLPHLFPPIEEVYPNEYGIAPLLGGTTGYYNKNIKNNNNSDDSNYMDDESKDTEMLCDTKKTITKDSNGITNKNIKEKRTKDIEEDVPMYGND